MTLSPTADDEIVLNDNIIHADSEDAQCDYVRRGNRLYNLTDHTYEFTGDIEVTVVYSLDWNDLPEYARIYIAARAARILSERYDRDRVIIDATRRKEQEARMKLVEEDAIIADANPLVDNPDLASANFFGGRSLIERRR